MNTAQEIASKALSDMTLLRKHHKTLQGMFDAVARQTGVSESGIRKFYYGTKGNPSVVILDKLAAGINVLMERL